MNEPTKWPAEITNGNITITVYRNTRQKGDATYTDYKVVYFDPNQENKRTFRTFSDWERAEAFATNVSATLGRRDTATLTLTAEDVLIYKRSQESMKALPGISMDLAVQDYVRVRLAAGNRPLHEIVDYFNATARDIQHRTVRQVVDELVKLRSERTKRGRPASPKYIEDLEKRLGKFADDFQVNIASVTGPMIDAWVTGEGFKGRTRFNYLRLIQTLFRYAQSKRYYPKNIDPMEDIEAAYDDDGEIEIFTREELARILNAARPELVPFVAISAFAGLRHWEIKRLDWADVKKGHIEVTKGKAKVRSRRTVPILPNLQKWLAPYRKESGPVVEFANIPKQIAWLAEATAKDGKLAVKWKHNGLRHSFISYRVAQLQNVNQVALEAGNSVAMIDKHYRQLVTQAQGRAWFSLAPDKSKVVPMPAQAAV